MCLCVFRSFLLVFHFKFKVVKLLCISFASDFMLAAPEDALYSALAGDQINLAQCIERIEFKLL